MTGTAIFALALIFVAVLAAVAIVAIASRRSDRDGPVTVGELDRKAQKADKARRKALVAAAVTAAPDAEQAPEKVVPAPREYAEDEPRREISSEDYGITRRKFFNRATAAIFGLFMLQFALAGLAFFWPKLKGGFGTPIKAGNIDDLKLQVVDGAAITPVFIPSAQSWIVPFEMSELPGSSFEATPFVVAGGEGDGVGLMALWQRCVHLGCRVPSCVPSQGFECPCHGSKYNRHGEYEQGPAPRNLDRFSVSVDETGQFVIDTGTIVQTARAKNKTVAYPQGPFCVG